jgi:succinylglutamate desuccinylase
MQLPVPNAVRAMVEGDFTRLAERFSCTGFAVCRPGQGIIRITTPQAPATRLRLLLSVGMHGDETAPIEMLAQVLSDLATHPHELAVDLMVAVGNLDAIAQGRRYVDADLNRLFRTDRGGLASAAEAGRANLLMRAAAEFFVERNGEKWHLDLHAAIRPSRYPAFAIVPDAVSDPSKCALIDWLGAAGIGAIVLNRKPAGTFSAYNVMQFGATGCTVELGQIGALGTNDLSLFAPMQKALEALLRSGRTHTTTTAAPHVFNVAQEIVKRSDGFQMAFDSATENFTPLEPGALIARDGDVVYRVGSETEYVVFPNPDVMVGQRAGLTVMRVAYP